MTHSPSETWLAQVGNVHEVPMDEDVIKFLRRSIGELEAPQIPEGGFTRRQFQKEFGVGKATAIRILGSMVEEGKLRLVPYVPVGHNTTTFYVPVKEDET